MHVYRQINIPTPVLPSVLEQVLPPLPPVSFSFTGGKQLQVVKYQCHEMCIYLKIFRNKTEHSVLVLMTSRNLEKLWFWIFWIKLYTISQGLAETLFIILSFVIGRYSSVSFVSHWAQKEIPKNEQFEYLFLFLSLCLSHFILLFFFFFSNHLTPPPSTHIIHSPPMFLVRLWTCETHEKAWVFWSNDPARRDFISGGLLYTQRQKQQLELLENSQLSSSLQVGLATEFRYEKIAE